MKGDQAYWVNPIGTKAPDTAVYVVLDLANDPAAREAMKTYAAEVGGERAARILEQVQEMDS